MLQNACPTFDTRFGPPDERASLVLSFMLWNDATAIQDGVYIPSFQLTLTVITSDYPNYACAKARLKCSGRL